jgi:hypothetical protein
MYLLAVLGGRPCVFVLNFAVKWMINFYFLRACEVKISAMGHINI